MGSISWIKKCIQSGRIRELVELKAKKQVG
jgi:hypothetical protein